MRVFGRSFPRRAGYGIANDIGTFETHPKAKHPKINGTGCPNWAKHQVFTCPRWAAGWVEACGRNNAKILRALVLQGEHLMKRYSATLSGTYQQH